MKTAKVTYSDGDIIITSINGSNETILKYFEFGKVFNIGQGEYDNMQSVVKCEILD